VSESRTLLFYSLNHLTPVNLSVNKFYVVVFEEEQSTAIIPDLWLRGNNSALWPPYKTSLRQNSAVQNEEVPGESWAVYLIRLLYSGKYHAAAASEW